MRDKVVKLIASATKLSEKKVEEILEVPKDFEMGDYAFPCFSLAKELKKNPAIISKEISEKIKPERDFEKIEAVGAYVNFFVNPIEFSKEVIKQIKFKGDLYGSGNQGKGKSVVVEFSSPNIAKPFGIGHLRSTIIGNSIAEISKFQGFKSIRINYMGDWGTQFGKLIVGYKMWGSEGKLKSDPIKHLLELYVRVSQEGLEKESREWFRKLESGDRDARRLWGKFRSISIKEFDKIYARLGVKFDVISGESDYNDNIEGVVGALEKKKLLKDSDGAKIVDLNELGLGVCLIKKSDGATLYATRDLAAAIERYKKYKFHRMIYEVGSEQRLHFNQIFKVLELMGNDWAKRCEHADHGLYLDSDGKKFATRKGKTVFMEDILDETTMLAEKEILKRDKSLSKKELKNRAERIAISAIFYGDLKNYRKNDIVFDLKRFVSFEGDTGPYLLYSYARAKSILRKKKGISEDSLGYVPNKQEKALALILGKFPDVVNEAYNNLSPNVIANYSYDLSRAFNEFYHESQVIGSPEEKFRLELVECFSQVLKNSLRLLGINVLEKM
ncbi:arginine--tRNA ligase [Candidatus Pacearchaeota archaeon CG10_big_fil_rev_8_21_14_0_10_34_76]|nr:MAG: arginine--tRNA ligase [Candidatus Pacearchaeota archaeon CG10_big_fil_rev_8_21_14_0_10_34_76]